MNAFDKGAQRRLAAQHAVTRVLADSASLEEAVPKVLEAAGECLGWQVGALWLVEPEAGQLKCHGFWAHSSVTVSRFEATTRQRTFEPGIGLPGRVWSSGQPTWIPDVDQDANFPRAATAHEEGLHAAFAFPLRLDGEVLGAVEFFSREIQQPDEEILRLMASTGSQLGQFISRKRAEQALREREQRYALALRHSHTGAWDYDLASRRVVWSEALHEITGLPPETHLTFETIIDLIHPDDREHVVAATRPMVEAAEEITVEFRICSPAHGERWVVVAGRAAADTHGRPSRLSGIARDITDHKRAEEALRDSEQRFARFTQHLPGLAWIKDLEGRYVYANAAAAKVFRGPLSELYGKTDDDIFPPETAAQFQANDRLALQSGAGLQAIETLLQHDGVLHSSIVSKFPIPGSDGRPAWVGGVAIDITEQKRAEEALRQSEARKSAVLNTALDAIITINQEGRIVEFNPAAERMFGYGQHEVLGQVMADLIIPPPLRQGHRQGMAHYLATGEGPALNRRLELTAVRSTGEQFPVEVAITRLVQDGPPLFTGYIRDVTEQKRAEEALRVAQEQLQLVTDTMDAPVTRCSRDLTYLWVNKPYADWIDRPAAEIIGRPILEIIGPEAFRRLQPHFKRVLSGARVHYEEAVDYQGLGRRWISATYSPTFDHAGVPDGWVAVVIDINDRKQLEEALRAADRRKDEFLATLAHELRNPLAPVRSSVNILKAKCLSDPEVAWSRDVIDRQVQQMARLLDDLLDVSRITRNKLELRTERVELATVVESALETSRPLIEASGHQLLLDLPTEPLRLDADPVRLAQVFSNLLNNAAKYTDPGGRIRLSAERQGSDVVVAVQDNGIGIPADVLPRLFEIFSQVTPALARSQGGLGIGLSLVRGLVELHGGSVEALSAGPGQGSEFVVRLPLLVEASSPPALQRSTGDRERKPQRCGRILVVDDNRDAANTLALLLRLSGNEVQTAYDGEQAVAAADSFRPTVVLLDIGMPKLNGYEAARHIRQQPWGQNMLLIALTGWGQEEDRRRTSEAGFDHHLVKPIDLATLLELLAGLEPAVA